MYIDMNISTHYYNDDFGYVSANKFYKKLKIIDPKTKFKDVKAFVDKQYTAQVTKPFKKPSHFSSIVSPAVGNNYQMDILVYDRYEYHNYKYILCCIDVFSRYVACRAMTNRQMSTIISNVKSIFEELGIPKNLNCDNEFNKKEFNDLIEKDNIKVFYSQPDEINKNAIIERFNRTIAELMQRWRTATHRYDWYNALPALIKNYNTTFHGTIKTMPLKLFFKYEGEASQQITTRVSHLFKVGDLVRIRIEKQTFDKGDYLKYSQDIYRIFRIDGNKIYLINTVNEEMNKDFYKPYQIISTSEVQTIPTAVSNTQADKHDNTVISKRIDRALLKEGINRNDDSNARRTLRADDLKNKLRKRTNK
jgi:hypothetical protein